MVAAKLSSRVIPIESEGGFHSLFTAVVLVGPKCPSSLTGPPAVPWSLAKLVKAAVALRHVARGLRAVVDAVRSPRKRAFWAGIRRPCVHTLSRESPLLLTDMRAVGNGGGTGLPRSLQAVASNDLPAVGRGVGYSSEDAVAARPATSMSIAFFGVRRASEVAALDLSEVSVDLVTGAVDTEMRRQKNDRFGLGRFAHIAPLPLREGGCPVHLLSGRMSLFDRCGHACRLAGADGRIPLFCPVHGRHGNVGFAEKGAGGSKPVAS